MLETIREYAAGRLEDSGEAEELRRRHAQHFLALAEEAEPNLRVGSPNEWFDRLEREHDNLRAALDRLGASGENELALRLAGAVWGFWSMTDHLVEGRRRLESALCSDERPTAARAKALNGAADLAVGCGDPVAARRRAEEALALHRKLGDAWGAALSLLLLGQAAREEGDLARAQQLFEESARRFRELGDEHYTHSATRGLAWTCAKLGDRERARALYEDDLRRARATSNKRIEAYSLSALAMMAVDEGRAEDAVPMLKETDRISRELGDYPLQTAVNFCRSANALAFAGRAGAAARLLSWADAQHEELGASVLTWLAEINEQTLATVRTQLDEAAFSEAWQQGRRMTVDEAFALALDL
jgi:tetratricopeptide (TPR) repeat protein